jgi:sorbitol/mannitol transport system permease protein
LAKTWIKQTMRTRRPIPIQPSQVLRIAVAWAVTLLLFFPLGWLILTAFKTELQAINVPPLWIFEPTLENFSEVQERSNYLQYAENSLVTSVVSTVLGLLIAAPAAYSMACPLSARSCPSMCWRSALSCWTRAWG